MNCIICNDTLTGTKRQQVCKTRKCKNEYTRRRKAAQREALNEIKLESGCIQCGYAEHPVALEFNHRDPEKKEFSISPNVGMSWERLIKEVEKCDVLCSNCHQILTYEEQHYTTKRG